MLRVLKHMEYKDRLGKLIVHLEKTWLREYLTGLCNNLINDYRQDGARLFVGCMAKGKGQ